VDEKKDTQIEDAGRRKAVKTIVGGVAAVAAYNVLPSKWGVPVIEQVFLPTHAATSGFTGRFYDGAALGGQWGRVSLTVSSNGSATFVRINANQSRRWEASFSSIPDTGTLVETDRSTDATCVESSNPSGPGGGPSSTISLDSVSATEAIVSVGGGGGAEFTLTIPAGTIPYEPSLNGTCTSGRT
jgi:hypothetical protein